MKKNTLLLFFLVFSCNLFAINSPQIDSLIKKLIYTEDSLKAGILCELSWEVRNSEPEKAIDFGQEAIQFAETYKNYEALVKAHGFIGVAYRILGNYSEAMDYFYKGLELAKKYEQVEQEGYAYVNIGNLHIYQGYYYNAIENLMTAKTIAEKLSNERMLGYVHLNIGRAQMLRNENHKALENFKKALNIRIQVNQVSGMAVCYKYIGDINMELGENAEALENYRKSLEVLDKSMDKDLYANILTKLSKAYFFTGNYNLAESNAKVSMKIAKEIGAKLIIRDNLKILSEIDLKTNKYKSASQHLEYIISYNDTLFNQQLSEKMFNLEYQFEKEKDQAKIDLLNKDKRIQELELHRARTFITALLIILVLISGVFIFVSISLRQRRERNRLLERQKQELDNINKTKDKMFLIIGHDLRGPIGNLKSLIELLLEDEEVSGNKELLETFRIFMKSVQSVSDLLENLLLWAKNQRNEIIFQPENISINAVINRNLQLFKSIADHKGIKLIVNIESNLDVFADKNMLMTVVRNLISNAVKYTSGGGSIEIGVELEDGYCKVTIKDSGVGFSHETAMKIFDAKNFYTTSGTNNETGSGLGLSLSKEFIDFNGGRIWAESNPGKGAAFYFTLPLSKY